ncbi:MAG: hypothetical protein AAFZ63_10865 [Bacteroidota bacterium]
MKEFLQRLRTIDSNFIIAASAVVISLCALLVSLQEVRIMRQQQKATMFPFVTASRAYNNDGFRLEVRNSGTGLAKINSVLITDGEEYYTNWLEVIEAYLPDSLVFGYDKLKMNTINGLIITPNESVNLFSVLWSPATRMLEERTRNLQLIICYSSLLDDHWKLEDGVQQPIAEPCDRIEEQEFY